MARIALIITARDQTARAFRAINARADRLDRSFTRAGTSGGSIGGAILRGLRGVGPRMRSMFSGGFRGVAGRMRTAFSTGVRSLPGLLRRGVTGGLRGLGRGIRRGIVSGARGGFRLMRGMIRGVFGVISTVLGGALRVAIAPFRAGFITALKRMGSAVGPIMIAILAPVLLWFVAELGAALAGALVFAFGAAFVGLAGFIASKAPAVKSAWSKMVDDVKASWASAGKAMEPVILHGIDLLHQLSDAFLPHFKEAMRGAAGPLQDFLDHFAQGMRSFGSRAFAPMMEGFDAFLLALGPEWDGMMQGMGDAFGALGRTVRDHSGEIAMAFTDVIGLITTLVDIVNFLARAWTDMFRVVTAGLGYLIKYGIGTLVDAVLRMADDVLTAAAWAFGWIPGIGGKIKNAKKAFHEWHKDIVSDLEDSGQKLIDWGKDMDRANRKRKLKVDIGQWEKDLEQAKKDLKDTLSKKAVKKLQMQIKDWTDKLATARKDLTTTTKVKAKAKLEGTISDLEAKIKRAKQLLADQSRRKSKSAIRGDISNLEAKIRKAKRDLNNLNGKTATTYVVTSFVTKGAKTGNAPAAHRNYATGGVVGMATGGLSRASADARGVLVGEQGPEFVQMPTGSRVRPNGWTRQAMNENNVQRQPVLRIESGPGDVDRMLLKILRRAVRNEGGDLDKGVGIRS